ncbi:unnamed protein product [Ilex paraguariensis]|uniref:Uncharacterized protein n=1 Tax=Ilex paraguariensis TaxID=185542 RepID=A0ABC8TAP3_9AQUA
MNDMALVTSTPLSVYHSLPKLKVSAHEDKGTCISHEQDSQCQRFAPTLSEVVEEIKQLYAIAFPMIITGLLIYSKSAISMVFMGRLGKEALAGGSFSIGIANITGYSVISGLAMGMEALSSQAYGAKQWPLMGHTSNVPLQFSYLLANHLSLVAKHRTNSSLLWPIPNHFIHRFFLSCLLSPRPPLPILHQSSENFL